MREGAGREQDFTCLNPRCGPLARAAACASVEGRCWPRCAQMKLERSKQEHSVQAAMEAQEKSFGRITRSLSGEASAGLKGRDSCLPAAQLPRMFREPDASAMGLCEGSRHAWAHCS